MTASAGGWWIGKFALPDGKPSYSDIWATDAAQAEDIARRLLLEKPRRLRHPPKEFRPSRLAMLEGGLGRPDVFHSLCYLSFLAGRCGAANVVDVVGDGSPLHELAHYLGSGGNIRGGTQLAHLRERILWLEGIIPGMPPEHVELTAVEAFGVRRL
jgi:hypothetical protein